MDRDGGMRGMTIKTQGGKVITKGGKVSCECCGPPEPDPPCCPYRAIDLLEEFYSGDDLPDTLFYSQFDVDEEVDLTGVLTKEFPPTRDDPREGYPIYYAGPSPSCDSCGSEVLIVFDLENEKWRIFGPVGGRFFASSVSLGGCLIAEYDSANFRNPIVTDQLADTYSVSGPISGTVTRQNDCVWSGTNLRLTNFNYQWKLNGNNKSGFQNTPVGSYAGGFTVS
jgi:hypothetical protein